MSLGAFMMLDLKEGQEPTEFIHADKLTRMLFLALSPQLLLLLAAIESLVITNDNRHLIAGSADKCITIYDISLKKPVWRFLYAHASTL